MFRIISVCTSQHYGNITFQKILLSQTWAIGDFSILIPTETLSHLSNSLKKDVLWMKSLLSNPLKKFSTDFQIITAVSVNMFRIMLVCSNKQYDHTTFQKLFIVANVSNKHFFSFDTQWDPVSLLKQFKKESFRKSLLRLWVAWKKF